jgi:hypothetical protein
VTNISTDQERLAINFDRTPAEAGTVLPCFI